MNEEEEEGVIDIRINNKFLSLKKWPILATFSTTGKPFVESIVRY